MPKNIFEKIIIFKNFFIENILRRKSFYVETKNKRNINDNYLTDVQPVNRMIDTRVV
jgi:hypothetical protein